MSGSMMHILRAASSTLWAIQAEKLDQVLAFLALRAGGERFTREEVAARIGATRERPGQPPRGSGVAVIPVYGIIAQHMAQVDDISSGGGTSTEEIGALFDQAMANDDVGTIILAVDSPGGTVYGVPELVAHILEAKGRGPKRVVACATSLMASAAYWISAAADEIVASPSAEVGSIGVYSAHIDMSGAQEQAGMKVSIFSAGKYKAEGALGQPLSDEAKAAEQARVEEMYGMFVADVARGRNVKPADVRGGFGEGRVVGAKQAKALGMVDRVATLEETVARYLKRAAPRVGANADTLRKDLALKALAPGRSVS
jgi:signal peptide peptidase SppA